MSDLFVELSNRAQALTPQERAQLAEVLLESLHGSSPPDIATAWDDELQARISAYERGEASLAPATDVFAEARRLTG